jgi:hypothetical protein
MQEASQRAHLAAIAEERRRAVQEAAERQREEVRQKLEAKLARGKPRIASDCALQCDYCDVLCSVTFCDAICMV